MHYDFSRKVSLKPINRSTSNTHKNKLDSFENLPNLRSAPQKNLISPYRAADHASIFHPVFQDLDSMIFSTRWKHRVTNLFDITTTTTKSPKKYGKKGKPRKKYSSPDSKATSLLTKAKRGMQVSGSPVKFTVTPKPKLDKKRPKTTYIAKLPRVTLDQ